MRGRCGDGSFGGSHRRSCSYIVENDAAYLGDVIEYVEMGVLWPIYSYMATTILKS